MSPSKLFSIVATPTGRAVLMAGSAVTAAGLNAFTLNVPLARMARPYRPGRGGVVMHGESQLRVTG